MLNLEQRRAVPSSTGTMWAEQKTCPLYREHVAASVKLKHFQIQKPECFTLKSFREISYGMSSVTNVIFQKLWKLGKFQTLEGLPGMTQEL